MERRKTQDIEKNVCLIEADRVKDNKYLFLHYIHSELEYHAKAVEKLSQLFNQINLIEPLEKMPEFMRSYNIKADLREINIDMEEIERNKERRLKYQADQVNKVFGKDSNENYKDENYCDTCEAYRDPKTYHCGICNVCIKKYDHHCVLTSKCIGGYNIILFYLFLISAIGLYGYTIVLVIMFIFWRKK